MTPPAAAAARKPIRAKAAWPPVRSPECSSRRRRCRSPPSPPKNRTSARKIGPRIGNFLRAAKTCRRTWKIEGFSARQRSQGRAKGGKNPPTGRPDTQAGLEGRKAWAGDWPRRAELRPGKLGLGAFIRARFTNKAFIVGGRRTGGGRGRCVHLVRRGMGCWRSRSTTSGNSSPTLIPEDGQGVWQVVGASGAPVKEFLFFTKRNVRPAGRKEV